MTYIIVIMILFCYCFLRLPMFFCEFKMHILKEKICPLCPMALFHTFVLKSLVMQSFLKRILKYYLL